MYKCFECRLYLNISGILTCTEYINLYLHWRTIVFFGSSNSCYIAFFIVLRYKGDIHALYTHLRGGTEIGAYLYFPVKNILVSLEEV